MTQAFEKMKVLAVDDNRTNLHILQVFLRKLGHEVILAENGAIAVECFERDRPDLVLLDIMMPIMDGFEAARRIKAASQERWTPIIFLSALNRDENLVEGLEAGADDYLTKPINFVVLEAKLRSMQRTLAMQQVAVDALERLRAVSDNVLDAIITADERGVIASVNVGGERMFGWSRNEMIGQPISLLMPDAFAPTHAEKFSSFFSDGSHAQPGREREGTAKHRDGHHFPVSLGITQLHTEEGHLVVAVIRDISERKRTEQELRENAKLLQAYFERTQAEQHLALRLMEKQLHRPSLTDPRLRYKVIASEHFSGDIVGASRSADGRYFYALLGDATGHGLPAAISALPLLALFYRMTRLSRPVREIIIEANQQLTESMPLGRFVAVSLLCLDEKERTGEIWVGGTPQVQLIDRWGRVQREFASDNLPLGIVPSDQLAVQAVTFEWEADSQLILCSDGLLEATDAKGVQFGVEGLLKAVANTSPQQRFAAIETAFAHHLGDRSAADDVSLIIVDCQ